MITENIDLAQVMIYLFWVFFAGLLVYLRREDRREGYPLESDTMPGRLLPKSLLFYPAPKTFLLDGGRGAHHVPNGQADLRPIAAQPVARWPGAPLQPTDSLPLLSGVGPGAWAERSNTTDMTLEGHAKIVPLRVAPAYAPAADGPDPRGYTVVGLDRAVAGTVTDLWIDRSECVLRYLEVTLKNEVSGGQPTAGTPTRLGDAIEANAPPRPATTSTITNRDDLAPPATAPGARTVLVPVTFANIHRRRRTVTVKAVLGNQLAMAPQPTTPDQLTFLDEDKIAGFYGAGMLYATRHRAEPLL